MPKYSPTSREPYNSSYGIISSSYVHPSEESMSIEAYSKETGRSIPELSIIGRERHSRLYPAFSKLWWTCHRLERERDSGGCNGRNDNLSTSKAAGSLPVVVYQTLSDTKLPCLVGVVATDEEVMVVVRVNEPVDAPSRPTLVQNFPALPKPHRSSDPRIRLTRFGQREDSVTLRTSLIWILQHCSNDKTQIYKALEGHRMYRFQPADLVSTGW